MQPLSPTALANTVTAYATCLAGIVPLLMCVVGRPHPARWQIAYAGILLTGIPTVWYHGFGETFWAGVADSGTNLLLAWLLQVAALGDYYSRRTRRLVGGVSAAVNLAAIGWRIGVGALSYRIFPVSFGDFGGFSILEIVLISDSLLAVGLLYIKHAQVPVSARGLLYLMTAMFVAGACLASGSNHRLDFVVMAWHATWHVVGAFGFVVLWAFNNERFSDARPRA